MKTKKIKDSTLKNSSLPLPDFPTAVARIAVAQICQSVGYRGAQTSALETLTDVAVRYLRSLAKSAATSACSTGRTQSNLLDVVCALEDLHSVLGFQGNSEPKRRLNSLSDLSLLSDMMKFVNRSREIPFAQPLPRHRRTVPCHPPHFSDDSTKWNHIPRWLPAFPKVIDDGETMAVTTTNESEIASEKKMCSTGANTAIGKLPEKRKKVSFRIGGGGRNEIELGFGVDLRSGVCKGGKRISCQIYDDDDDDDDEQFVDASGSNNHATNRSVKNILDEVPNRTMVMMN